MCLGNILAQLMADNEKFKEQVGFCYYLISIIYFFDDFCLIYIIRQFVYYLLSLTIADDISQTYFRLLESFPLAHKFS